jgi:hypothetical protein
VFDTVSMERACTRPLLNEEFDQVFMNLWFVLSPLSNR